MILLDDPGLSQDNDPVEVYASLDGKRFDMVGHILCVITKNNPFILPVDPGLVGQKMWLRFHPASESHVEAKAHEITVDANPLKIARG
jgi:hypothetical protein